MLKEETKMFKHSRTYLAIPPGATIKEMIDDRGISEAELARRMDENNAFTRDLIEGEVELDEKTAERLAQILGMNVRFWLGLERGYREKLAKVAEENAEDAKTEQTETSSRGIFAGIRA